MPTPGAKEMGYVLPGETGVVNIDRNRERKGDQSTRGRDKEHILNLFRGTKTRGVQARFSVTQLLAYTVLTEEPT